MAMPAITFNCPNCQQSIQTPEEFAGESATCCYCQQIIQVPNYPVEDLNPYLVASCNLLFLLIAEVEQINKIVLSMTESMAENENLSGSRLLADGLDAHRRVTDLCEKTSQLSPPQSLEGFHAEILKYTQLIISWVSFLKEAWILGYDGQFEESSSMSKQAVEALAAAKSQNMQILQLLAEVQKQAKRKA
jgi:hypothetical protein